MSTINELQDYSTALFLGTERGAAPIPQKSKETREQESKGSLKQQVKKSRAENPKESRKQDNKMSRHQDIKNTREQENKNSQEDKKSRVVIDKEGKTRRPANITISDDVKIAIDILAARRQVKTWTLIDEALRAYLKREEAREAKKELDGGFASGDR